MVEPAVSEAEKLGFEQIIISSYNMKGLDLNNKSITLRPVKKIEDVFSLLFG